MILDAINKVQSQLLYHFDKLSIPNDRRKVANFIEDKDNKHILVYSANERTSVCIHFNQNGNYIYSEQWNRNKFMWDKINED